MARRVVSTSRLGRRLTVAFALVAAVSSGALAAGSYFLVRQSRLDDSLSRAAEATRRNLRAGPPPVAGGPEPVQDYVETFQLVRGTPAMLLIGDQQFRSDPSLEFTVPATIRRVVRRGEIGFQRITVDSEPWLLTGARPPGAEDDVELYFLFPEANIARDLEQLRNVLLIGLGVVVVLAGMIGRAVSRRTLHPVAQASRAARSIAEGLLDTRLPVEGGDEFGDWAASFNEMAEALESKIAALTEAQARERRFTSDVAHELRTPLTALVGEASILREHLDQMPDEARRPAEMLVTDVARLRKLVEDVLEVSRLDAGQATVHVETLDLGSLVQAILRARGWQSRVTLHAEEVVLDTDRRRVERVVANLVGNAVEHGGREVAVRVGRDGMGAFVEVSDRGRGIAPEHVGHLFDRFYKADPARTGPGAGLGLNIALENAQLLGGDIDVWSEVGEGTRFTLRLPVTQRLRRGESQVSGWPDDQRIVEQKEVSP
jgi:signal transduction histidine kinase